MTLSLGDERGLEVRIRGRLPVAGGPRQLEGPLDVLTGALPVALAAVAAGTPAENVGAERVGSEPRALRELESRGQQSDGGGDAGQLVAGDAEPEEHRGAVDVGERRPLGELARAGERGQRLVVAAELDQRPGLAEQEPELEIARAGALDRLLRTGELLERLGVLVCLGERLRAGERRLGAGPVGDADAGLEEVRIDAELLGQPLERVRRRARLAALDLADVLLREPAAGEVALGQAAGDAKRLEPLTDAAFSVFGPRRRSEVRVVEITSSSYLTDLGMAAIVLSLRNHRRRKHRWRRGARRQRDEFESRSCRRAGLRTRRGGESKLIREGPGSRSRGLLAFRLFLSRGPRARAA